MKIRNVMTDTVIRISPEETAAVAARMLTHYNIGSLPVCGRDGRVCGVITDRDLVIRCVAAGKDPGKTRVRDLMTGTVVAARPDMDLAAAAALMGREQIRRLPVVENGRLCGMVSLGDLAEHDRGYDAAEALADISSNVSSRYL